MCVPEKDSDAVLVILWGETHRNTEKLLADFYKINMCVPEKDGDTLLVILLNLDPRQEFFCVAVCFSPKTGKESVLQCEFSCVAVCCWLNLDTSHEFFCVVVCCSVLQCVALRCQMLQ